MMYAHTLIRSFVASLLGVSLLGLPVVHATEAAPQDSQTRLLETIMSGRSAQAQIEALQKEGNVVRAAADLRRGMEARQLGDAQSALMEVLQKLAQRPADTGLFGQAVARYEAWRAAVMLVEMKFARAGEQLERSGEGGAYLGRHQRETGRASAALAQIKATLDPILTGPAPKPDLVRKASQAAIDLMIKQPSRLADRPILRANAVPFGPLNLPPRQPVITPGLVPSYENVAETAPAAADHQSTTLAPLTDEIIAKAASLDNDYVKIYEYVRNNVRTQWYAGAVKGALGTLRSASGNDVDQAVLLTALLRAAGLDTHYVQGVVEIPVERVAADFGLSAMTADAVPSALTKSGVAFTSVNRGGKVAAVQVAHTWVSANVPYTNYRGALVDASGKTWIPLDPSYKQVAVKPSTGYFKGFSADELSATFLTRGSNQNFADFIRQKVQSSLGSSGGTGNWQDQRASGSIVPLQLSILPNSLPYPVLAVTYEGADVQGTEQTRLHIVVRRGNKAGDAVALDRTIAVADAVASRVTLSYGPASVEDHRIALLYGGMDAVPLYLISLRPQLKVDGKIVAMGTDSVDPGAALRLELEIEGPWGRQAVNQTVVAGSYQALVLSHDPVHPAVASSADGEYNGARLLDGLGTYYASQWSEADTDLASLMDVGVARPVPALTMVSTVVRPVLVAGVPVTLEWAGVSVDAALRPVDAVGTRAADFLALSGLAGSSYESAIFQSQFAVSAVSADRGIQLASEQGVSILQLGSANAAQLDGTAHAASVKTAVQDLLRQGFAVQIPASPISVDAWSGSVWRAVKGGQSGYFLSGGLAGGETAIPPDQWPLGFLADAFRAMQTEAANNDPRAGVAVEVIGAGDGQRVKAGEAWPAPLSVRVTDKIGRPVVGAQVTFALTTGDAKLAGGATSLTVPTNVLGIAAVTAFMGTSTGVNPVWTNLSKGDKYATRVGYVTIDASADSLSGPLHPDAPFSALSLPGALADLKRTSPETSRGYAGMLADQLTLLTADQYGNPIANQSVDMQISTAAACSGGALKQGALIDNLDKACWGKGVLGMCGSPTLNLTTRSDGVIYVNVILGNDMAATNTLRASSSGISREFTYQAIESCNNARPFAWLSWTGGLMDQEANDVAAAAPGKTFDKPVLVNFYRDDLQYVIDPGPTLRFLPYRNSVNASGNITSVTATNGGAAENITTSGTSGSYVMRGGPTPARIDTNIRVEVTMPVPRLVSGQVVIQDQTLSISGGGATMFSVKPSITTVQSKGTPSNLQPERVYLNGDGVSLYPISVGYKIEPASYKTLDPVVRILLNGKEDDFAVGNNRQDTGEAVLPRAKGFDRSQNYEAKLSLFVNTDNWLDSDKKAIPIRQKLIAGISRETRASRYVDAVNRRVCERPGAVTFVLTQDALITLSYQMLDAVGQPIGSEQKLVDDKPYPTGQSVYQIDTSAIGSGQFRVTLKARAIADASLTDEAESELDVRYQIANALPVGQTLVKGVNVRNGSLTNQTAALSIPGRGPSFDFAATYSSMGAGSISTVGANWSHSFDLGLQVNSCGEAMVSAGDSGSVRFFPKSDGSMRPDKGYHGTLIANRIDNTWDFYSKDGTRYHYKFFNERVQWKIESITDRNGNTQSFEYDANAFPDPLLTKVRTSDGREYAFKHEYRNITRTFGSPTSGKGTALLTLVTGPGGTKAEMNYDDLGNLIEYKLNGRAQNFVYSVDLPKTEDRYRMLQAADARGNATKYVFGLNNLNVTIDNAQAIALSQFTVTELSTPLNGRYTFDLDTQNWQQSTVTNEVGGKTKYVFNSYGNPLSITDDAGTTLMNWATDDVLMLDKTDGRNVTTHFDHDTEGNVIRETVGGASSVYNYEIQTAAPYSKNRLLSKTDRNGKVYRYDLDAKGNVQRERMPEGIEVQHGYAANGDRLSSTDGRGKTTRFEYDSHGNLAAVQNPIGARVATPRDARGRVLSASDGNGNITQFDYDEQDNLLKQTNAEGKTRLAAYDAVGNKLNETDEAGGLSAWTYNAANQPLTARRTGPAGDSASKTFGYDLAGNKTSETDWLNHETTFAYDKVNRLTKRTEPLSKGTLYEYDAVGNLKKETDALTRVTAHDYDDLNRRISTVDAQNKTWGYGYDHNGNRTSSTDPLGRVTTMVYDGLNRLTDVKQPLGRTTSFSYDENGNKLSETDANTHKTTYEYDGANRLVATKFANGTSAGYAYDLANNLTQQTDEGSGIKVFTYDALNRRKTAKDQEGGISRYDYDPLGNSVTESLPNGNVLTHNYDLFNRRTSTSDSIGQVGEWVYDANGNLLDEADGRDKHTTHVYNALNQKTSSSLPGGRSLVFKSDLMGNLLESTDARANKTFRVYDALNRLKQTDLPDGGSIVITYDDAGNKLSETDGLGHPTAYRYDALNRVDQVTDALGQKVSYGYDLVGNKTRETDKRGTVTDFTYDVRNRLLSTTKAGIAIQTLTYTPLGMMASDTDGNGNTTTFEYDKRGLQTARRAPEGANTLEQRDAMGDVVQTTDPEGRVSKSKFDLRRKQTESTNPADETTTFEYDLNGNKTAMVRPGGTRTDYVFDDRGFMTEVRRPLADNTVYGYDKNGNLTSIKDANGHTTTFDHDTLNRRISVAYPGGVASESFEHDRAGNLKSHFDANGGSTSYLYDALNREKSRSYSTSADGLSKIETDYDANGNRLSVTQTYTGANAGTRVSSYTYDAFDCEQSSQDAFGARMAFVYDANGNRKSLTTQDGKVTAYGYDKLNRLISLVAPGNGGVNRRYDRSGLVTQEDWQSGGRTVNEYDGAQRPVRITLSQGGTPLSLIEYSYDNNGNRTEERINRPAGAQLTSYGYDELDRLTSTELAEGTTKVESVWTYDPAGNRQSEKVTTTVGSGTPTSVTRGYTYDARDRLSEITDTAAGTTTLGYDQQGNLKQKVQGGHTSSYVWNVRDHLIQYSVDGTVLGRYQTDHEGLRVQKEALDPLNPQAPPSTVRTLWDEANAVQDRDASGNLLRRYEFIEGRPVMLSVNNGAVDGLQYLHADALGSIIATTDTLSGAVKSETLYDAWGNPTKKTGESSNKFAYTGHQADAESGLYYFKARYYDPSTGRFISQDPAEGKALEPESYHKYLYAYANPLSFTDPTGMYSWNEFGTDLTRTAGGLTGAALGVATTAAGLLEVAGDIAAASNGNAAAAARTVQRGKAIAHAVANPRETVTSIKRAVNSELDGANREDAEGNTFTAAVVRGRLAAEATLAIDGGVGLVRGAAAAGSKLANASKVAARVEAESAQMASKGTATAPDVGAGMAEATLPKQSGRITVEGEVGPGVDTAPAKVNKSVKAVAAAEPNGSVKNTPTQAATKEPICGTGGPCSVYEIPASELIANQPYIGKTKRPVPQRMADKDHRAKTPAGTPPQARVLGENLTAEEAAGLEAVLAHERGLENLSNKIPPLNVNLPKNAAKLEAARKIMGMQKNEY